MKRVSIQNDITAPLTAVFDWFYHSENYRKSPMVFRSDWREGSSCVAGSRRDVFMVAGWYAEEITDIKLNRSIQYRVFNSFPKIKQDFTEISFDQLDSKQVRVTWTIEVEVPIPFLEKALSPLAGLLAKQLYATILTAGKKALEQNENQ